MEISVILKIFTVVSSLLSLFVSVFSYIRAKRMMYNKIQIINQEIKIKDIQGLKNTLFKINEIDDNRFLMISDNVIKYFKTICKNNKYTVNIFGVDNSNNVLLLYSTDDIPVNVAYNIEDNTDFSEVVETKKIYFNNNIKYFYEQGKFYNSSFAKISEYYQSTICCPINRENRLVGFLSINIKEPLNDLIDANNIIEYLEKICELISMMSCFD